MNTHFPCFHGWNLREDKYDKTVLINSHLRFSLGLFIESSSKWQDDVSTSRITHLLVQVNTNQRYVKYTNKFRFILPDSCDSSYSRGYGKIRYECRVEIVRSFFRCNIRTMKVYLFWIFIITDEFPEIRSLSSGWFACSVAYSISHYTNSRDSIPSFPEGIHYTEG